MLNMNRGALVNSYRENNKASLDIVAYTDMAADADATGNAVVDVA